MKSTDGTTRTPAGVPTGGQFAASARAEASIDLDAPTVCETCGDSTDEKDSSGTLMCEQCQDSTECLYCDSAATSVDSDGQDVCEEHADDAPERCVADDCDETLDDGEGFDGYCGTHADKIEAHNEGWHRAEGETNDDGDAANGRDNDCPNCNGARVHWE